MQVSVDHTADWWLGDLGDPWFKALENAVYEEWGTEPLRIREGGVCVLSFFDYCYGSDGVVSPYLRCPS